MTRLMLFAVLLLASGRLMAEDSASKEPPRELFSGKVLFAQAALKQRGIKVADEMKDQAVLETTDGELIPIAADWRGRAFFQDKRLRNRPVELVGYRQPGIPFLQVLVIFVLEKDGTRQEMDYWCDICSIPMYEIKECECCQGPIEFRLRPGRLPAYLKSRTPAQKSDVKPSDADTESASSSAPERSKK